MTCLAVPTPLGPLTIREDGGAIVELKWGDGGYGTSDLLVQAARQVTDYFAHRRETFDLPLRVEGSDLQRRVCAAMSAIPFGHTRTYGEIADELGVPAQAIGQACGGNPIPVIIPCHRVLGATSLGGFSAPGGVETKVALLKHEGAAGLLI